MQRLNLLSRSCALPYAFAPLSAIEAARDDEALIAATNFELRDMRPSRDFMTPAYVLDRLRVYDETLFGLLLRLSERAGGVRLAMAVSTGEMQVWLRRRP